MKKTICLYFQVHLPSYLRQYKFFDKGHSHHYFDDFKTRRKMERMAEESYLPLNKILLDLIKSSKEKFKVSFSLTGEVIEQMEKYAPKALDSFKALAKTGCVEFVNETYSHSLIFLRDEKEFRAQVNKNALMMKKHFGQNPSSLRLTGMIYSDQIGGIAAQMGYKTMLTEDAKHVMGWKTSNMVYSCKESKSLKLLLRNSKLSDRISFYFADQSKSYYPITCEKMVYWLNEEKGEIVNIFMDYTAVGYRHHKSSGIFEFIKYLPSQILADDNFEFMTPSEVAKKHKPENTLEVPYPISWYEAERDLSIWLGNDMQKDAFTSMCALGERIRFVNDTDITSDWKKLQDSDHFYFMCTRWQADEKGRRYHSPYRSPYDAYINYMNVLSDVVQRANDLVDRKLSMLMDDKKFALEMIQLMDFKYVDYTPSQVRRIIEITNTEKEKRASKKKTTTSKK